MDSKPGNSNNLESGTTTSSNVPPTVYILVQNPINTTPKDKHFEKTFPKKVVIILSSLQMISFILAFISQIVLIASNYGWYGLSDIGTGIWCGFFFGISGGLGLLAAYRPSSCSIISFMVMSIISACFCLPLLVISSIDVGINRSSYRYSSNDEKTGGVLVAFSTIQIIVALLMAVVTIVSSALSCRAICCRKQQTQGSVIYSAVGADGQPVAFQGLQPGAMPLGAGGVVIPVPASLPIENSISYPPPKYEAVNEEVESGDQYQRFS